jgi:hypothetical protein
MIKKYIRQKGEQLAIFTQTFCDYKICFQVKRKFLTEK